MNKEDFGKNPKEDNPTTQRQILKEQATEKRIRLGKEYPYLPILIVALLIIIAVTIFINKPTDFEGYIRSSGYLGVLLMGIIGSTSPFWPLPGSWAAFIAGGFGLNPLVLALSAGIGEPIGELTAYGLGYGGQATITNWEKYAQVKGWMRQYGTIITFLVSASPNYLIKLVVVAAGALRYPWWKFFLLCWAGKTIKSFGFAIAGVGFFNFVVNLLERIF